jgi:hypothetical protein
MRSCAPRGLPECRTHVNNLACDRETSASYDSTNTRSIRPFTYSCRRLRLLPVASSTPTSSSANVTAAIATSSSSSINSSRPSPRRSAVIRIDVSRIRRPSAGPPPPEGCASRSALVPRNRPVDDFGEIALDLCRGAAALDRQGPPVFPFGKLRRSLHDARRRQADLRNAGPRPLRSTRP